MVRLPEAAVRFRVRRRGRPLHSAGFPRQRRVFTVSVLLPDKPGELVRVAQIIANANGNVIKLEHNQFVSINRKATVELRITIEAFGHEHKDQIVSELEKNGLRPRLVKVNI